MPVIRKVHKLLLSTQSQFFKALFSFNNKEKREYHLHEVKREGLE